MMEVEVGQRYSQRELAEMGLLPELCPPEKLLANVMVVTEVDREAGTVTFESVIDD